MRPLPTPQGQVSPRRPRQPVNLWLRPLPAELTRETLTRWRAQHLEGHTERYPAAVAVDRAAWSADDIAEAASAAWAAESTALETVEPSKRQASWSRPT